MVILFKNAINTLAHMHNFWCVSGSLQVNLLRRLCGQVGEGPRLTSKVAARGQFLIAPAPCSVATLEASAAGLDINELAPPPARYSQHQQALELCKVFDRIQLTYIHHVWAGNRNVRRWVGWRLATAAATTLPLTPLEGMMYSPLSFSYHVQ